MQAGDAMIQALIEIFHQKKRLVLFTGGGLLFNIFLFFAISGYLVPAIHKATSKGDDLRRKVLAAGQSDVTTVFNQGKIDLGLLKEKVPARRQFPRVLGDILDAAASSQVMTGNITYKPAAIKDENLLAYSVSITVGGTYAAVKSFLADLQNYRELIVIDGLGLANTDPYEEFVTMELRMTIYLREGA